MDVTRTIETRQDFTATIGSDEFAARLFEGDAQITITSAKHGGAHVSMPAALLPALAEFAAAVAASSKPPIVLEQPAPEPAPAPE